MTNFPSQKENTQKTTRKKNFKNQIKIEKKFGNSRPNDLLLA